MDKIQITFLSDIMEIMKNFKVLELLSDLVEHRCAVDEDIMFCMDDFILHEEVGQGENDPDPSFEIHLEVGIAFLEEFRVGVAEYVLEHAGAVDDPSHHVHIIGRLSYE